MIFIIELNKGKLTKFKERAKLLRREKIKINNCSSMAEEREKLGTLA